MLIVYCFFLYFCFKRLIFLNPPGKKRLSKQIISAYGTTDTDVAPLVWPTSGANTDAEPARGRGAESKVGLDKT